MKKNTILLAGFILILFLSSAAIAQMGRGMGPGMMSDEEMMEKRGQGSGYGMGGMHGSCISYMLLMEELDLNETQAEKLKEIKNNYKKEQIRLKADKKIAHIEYGEALAEETVNLKEVEKIVKKIADIKTKLLMNAAEASANARKILTKEQRAKVKELARERRSQCQMQGGQGMMRGPRWSDD